MSDDKLQLPWTAGDGEQRLKIFNANGVMVADCSTNFKTRIEVEPEMRDAIVRAVNNYQKLVEALKYAKNKAEYGYKVRLPADCCVDIFVSADAVLTEIGGEQP